MKQFVVICKAEWPVFVMTRWLDTILMTKAEWYDSLQTSWSRVIQFSCFDVQFSKQVDVWQWLAQFDLDRPTQFSTLWRRTILVTRHFLASRRYESAVFGRFDLDWRQFRFVTVSSTFLRRFLTNTPDWRLLTQFELNTWFAPWFNETADCVPCEQDGRVWRVEICSVKLK